MLILPAEACAPRRAAGFAYRYLDERPSLTRGLAIGYVHERVTVNALDEAVTKRVERSAEGAHFVATEHALLNVRVDRPVIDQRPAGMINEVDAVEVPGPQFGDLTDPAGDRVLMAIRTCRGVVERPKPMVDGFTLLELRAVCVHLGLGGEPVSQVVKSGRRICDARLTVNGVVRVKWVTDPYSEKDQ